MPETSTQKLASLLLAQPVGDYIAAHRANGLSYRRIAQQLAADTDGAVDVTAESLRVWHEERAAA